MTKLLLLLMGIQLSRLEFNSLFFPPHSADFIREIFEKYVEIIELGMFNPDFSCRSHIKLYLHSVHTSSRTSLASTFSGALLANIIFSDNSRAAKADWV